MAPQESIEELYAKVTDKLQERKILAAFEAWEQNVNQFNASGGSLPMYAETTSRLRRDRNVIKSIFSDINDVNQWECVENHRNCSDFNWIKHSSMKHDRLLKIKSELINGDLNLPESASILKDMRTLPQISGLFSVTDCKFMDNAFTTTANVKVSAWYPPLWQAKTRRVHLNFFDCMDEYGAIVAVYTWNEDSSQFVTNTEPETVAVLFYPLVSNIQIYASVERTRKYSVTTAWMDQSYLAHELHLAITSFLTLSRRMVLCDPELAQCREQIVKRGTDYLASESDSVFGTWLRAILERKR